MKRNTLVKLLFMIFFIAMAASVYADVAVNTIAPKTGRSFQNNMEDKVEKMLINVDIIENSLQRLRLVGSYQDGGEFIDAVKYFNLHVAYKSRISAEDIVTLYELFRGDNKNQDYTTQVRKQRISTIKNNDLYHEEKIEGAVKKSIDMGFEKEFDKEIALNSTLLEYVNRRDFSTDEDIVNAVSKLYFYICLNNIFYDRPGFDRIYPLVMSTVRQAEQKRKYTYDGHHRIAWFLVNYMLINNGYLPYNYELGEADMPRLPRHKLFTQFNEIKEILLESLKKAPGAEVYDQGKEGDRKRPTSESDKNTAIYNVKHLIAA